MVLFFQSLFIKSYRFHDLSAKQKSVLKPTILEVDSNDFHKFFNFDWVQIGTSGYNY
jgi:hypothetical protein